jgi:hypothetical protein
MHPVKSVSQALEDVRSGHSSVLKAAKECGMEHRRQAFTDRLNGIPTRQEAQVDRQGLTVGAEEAIVRRILMGDRHGRAWKPGRITAVANMILAAQAEEPVGKNWVQGFMERNKDLKRRTIRLMDRARAKGMIPESVNEFYSLVSTFLPLGWTRRMGREGATVLPLHCDLVCLLACEEQGGEKDPSPAHLEHG